MKTAFRMLLSTLAAVAVLGVLYYAHGYFTAHSMLGDTVEQVTGLCFQLLAAVTVLLYLRCWLCLAFDGIRALCRWLKNRRRVRLEIRSDAPARLYDLEADGADESAKATARS